MVGSQIPTLLLAITYVLIIQMGHASPFWTFRFKELSNDIRNFSIQWVLTLPIFLWGFGNLSGLQFPMWEFIWECGGSFPHIFLYSWECEMWLLGSLLARTFASLCLGCEPKVRVATKVVVGWMLNLNLTVVVETRVQFLFVTSYILGLHDYIINQNTLLWIGNYGHDNVVYIYHNTLASSTWNYQVFRFFGEIFLI